MIAAVRRRADRGLRKLPATFARRSRQARPHRQPGPRTGSPDAAPARPSSAGAVRRGRRLGRAATAPAGRRPLPRPRDRGGRRAPRRRPRGARGHGRQREDHPAAGDRRRDRRRRRPASSSPSSSTTTGSRSASRATRTCPTSPSHRPSTCGPRAKRTPTCWCRWACWRWLPGRWRARRRRRSLGLGDDRDRARLARRDPPRRPPQRPGRGSPDFPLLRAPLRCSTTASSAELAAAGALVLAGLLYYARPCRIRISSSGRAASARRRRPRRRDSSPARVARSA